jgi:UDP-glucose 4-epimerase
LFNVYGPRGRGVVNVFQDGGNVIYGDGLQTRDFVHVSDVVNALVAAQQWDPGVYNVGTGVETTIEGLWHILRGDEVPMYRPFPPWELGRSFADTSKVEGLWKPHKELIDLCT